MKANRITAMNRRIMERGDMPVHEAHSSSRRLSAGLSASALAIRSAVPERSSIAFIRTPGRSACAATL
jgi:hypothetical protein